MSTPSKTGAFIYATDGSNVVLVFDTVMSEQHDETSVISEHAVEDGSVIGDNVRPDPVSIEIEGVISNTPTDQNILTGRGTWQNKTIQLPRNNQIIGGLFGLVSSLFASAPLPVQPLLLSFSDAFDAIKETQDQLTTWRDGKQFLGVTTMTRDYQNMQLTKVSMKRDSFGAGNFSLTLKQVRVVSTLTAVAPKPKKTSGAPKTNTGAQPPESLGSKIFGPGYDPNASLGINIGKFLGGK